MYEPHSFNLPCWLLMPIRPRWLRRRSSQPGSTRGRARCSRRRGTDNRARSLLRRCRRCHRRRSARYLCRRGPSRATRPPGISTRRTSVTRHARLPIRKPYHKGFPTRLSHGPLEGARRRCVTPPSPFYGRACHSPVTCHASSVYFFDVPRALSTGYFSALRAILACMASGMSTPAASAR